MGAAAPWSGQELDLAADLAAREVGRVHVAVHRAGAEARQQLLERDSGDVGVEEAALVELPVDAGEGVGGEVGARTGEERDADGSVDARGTAVEMGPGDAAAGPMHFDAVVHAVAGDVDANDAGGSRAPCGNLVGAGEVDHELLSDVVGGLVARREGKPQQGTRNADACLTHSRAPFGAYWEGGSGSPARRKRAASGDGHGARTALSEAELRVVGWGDRRWPITDRVIAYEIGKAGGTETAGARRLACGTDLAPARPIRERALQFRAVKGT